jgi:transposase
VVAFLAQQIAKAPIARLLRIHWETVGRIVERVVHDKLYEERLTGLVLIGVDEVSWRRRHRYPTCVARPHHDIVWIREGRNQATYEHAVRAACPDA